MKLSETDEQCMVELYVTGKLSAAEEASFEEYYLDRPQLIQAIEDAERLHRGLRQMAAEDLAVQKETVQRVTFIAAWRALRSRAGLALVAALLVVGLLPSWLLWLQLGDLGDDLRAARQELAEERRPRINTPVLTLAMTRSGEQPLQQISLLAEPEWIVLEIEVGDTARPLYEARLTDADGAVVWESPGLEPSFRGTLTLSLHSSLLPPGLYRLSLTGDDQRLVFPLKVVRL
ncbi:MAG: hypothetical protein AAGD06_30855 [Acidobacteriota bacterium]